MSTYSHEAKRYFCRLKKSLPCHRRLKKQILADIMLSLDAYLQENPSADMNAITLSLGTPHQIICAHLDQMDIEQLLATVRKQSRIRYVTVVACGIALLTTLLLLAFLITLNLDLLDPGYITIT